jgi:hypothetical protein
MPNFKPKHSKVDYQPLIITLDNKHNEHIEKFNYEKFTVIPELEQIILDLKQKLKLKLPMDEHLFIKDTIRQHRKSIHQLKKNKKKYFLDNSTHIFNYFEEKKKISGGKSDNIKLLNTFFKIGTDNDKQNIINYTNEYLINIDEKFVNMENYVVNSSVCKMCNEGELVPLEFEGVLICDNPNCSKQSMYLIENERPSYKEPPKEVGFYAYKRINHFREILAQFQAKESTQIPEDIIDNINIQIKKERINVTSITNKKAKEILKKLGYNKYYEHIPFIKDKLGIKPPIMSPELEDKLCNLFMEIQRPYAKYCPDDRVNFLNYYYTIYKLCELLEEDQFLEYFPMLKDREKRIEQDDIWKKICKDLNWEFIPTI